MPNTESKTETKELQEMYSAARKMLLEIGFQDITVKEIRLNNRLTRTLGRYFSESKIIEISKEHFFCSTKDEVMNTILHEISHNICENRYGIQYEDAGHSKEWCQIADFITEKTGYVIKRYTHVSRNRTKMIHVPVYAHQFQCKKCKWTYTAYSKKKDAESIRKRKCAECWANHKVFGEEYTKSEYVCVNTKIAYFVNKYVELEEFLDKEVRKNGFSGS